MLFTPVIALAGLAAAAPQGLVYRRVSNDTAPADIKVSRSTLNGNYTAPADIKVARSTLNGNYTTPAGIKLVSRSAGGLNDTGLSVTPSS